ncbi:MAG: RNA polymerase sigma factor [Christensenellaceae bacterium]
MRKNICFAVGGGYRAAKGFIDKYAEFPDCCKMYHFYTGSSIIVVETHKKPAETSMQEEKLITLAQAGDGQAFSELIERYEKRIYGIAYKFMRNDADSKDAAQEAILKMYRSIRRFSFRSAFSTWMYRIVVNACMDLLRKKKSDVPMDGYEEILAGSTGEPHSSMAQLELRTELMRAIRALPPKYMAVFVLVDVDGRRYEEAAKILEISVGTVKSRLFRAREKLRQMLKGKVL